MSYINREEAIRLIDEYQGGAMDKPTAKKILAEMDEGIVRCKDCKHYRFADNRAFGFPVKRCEWTGFEDVEDDDFCSYVERREDDNK